MRPISFREDRRYSRKEIIKRFDDFLSDRDDVERYLNYTEKAFRKLCESGIIKVHRWTDEQLDFEDEMENDGIVGITESSDDKPRFSFHFVGVIVVFSLVIVVYPKYCEYENDEYDETEMKRVISVIEKYKKSLKQSPFQIFDESQPVTCENLLSVELYILSDYWENGLYSNEHIVLEHNGNGEIHWDKTINNEVAILLKKRPIYVDVQTTKRVDDRDNYIKRLHKAVLTEISERFCGKHYQYTESENILSLFGMEPAYVTDEQLNDLGDVDYLSYRISQELRIQFNTRKVQLLKAILSYIEHDRINNNREYFSVYGTTSFQMVWQDVCSVVFHNSLREPLSSLGLSKYENKENGIERLIDLIEKPTWTITGTTSDKTLEPDIITINKDSFCILDAKYYFPTLQKGKKPKNVPGIGDIIKQYLYQQAYKHSLGNGYFRKHKPYNCFLLPDNGSSVINKENVNLQMLKPLNLKQIAIRYLPAQLMYESYLYGDPVTDKNNQNVTSDDILAFLQLE